MFLIYVNDLAELLNNLQLFADDVKLYIRISTPNDVVELQKTLSALVSWAEKWQLSVSIDKCCVLGIGKGNVPTQLFVNNLSLPVVSFCCDLGYTVTNRLSPSARIGDIVVKPHARANRCSVSRNVSLLVHAFTTFIGLRTSIA